MPTHRLAPILQTPLERVSFAAGVVESPIEERLAGLFSGHGNLLIACMKITSHNDHCSAPFFRASVVPTANSFRGLQVQTPSPGLLGARSRRLHPISLEC